MNFYNSFNEMFSANSGISNLSVFNERFVYERSEEPRKKGERRKQGFSECLDYVEWNEENPTILIIGFADTGAEYTYVCPGIDRHGDYEAETLFEGFKKTTKPGEFFNRFIKGRYQGTCTRPSIRGSYERQNEFNLTVDDVDKIPYEQDSRFDSSIIDKMDSGYTVKDSGVGRKTYVGKKYSVPNLWKKSGFSGNMPPISGSDAPTFSSDMPTKFYD